MTEEWVGQWLPCDHCDGGLYIHLIQDGELHYSCDGSPYRRDSSKVLRKKRLPCPVYGNIALRTVVRQIVHDLVEADYAPPAPSPHEHVQIIDPD
jgi:hypothetical protein